MDEVVRAGWRLPDHPACRHELGPLLYLANVRFADPYPEGATRVLRLLDESFRRNVDEILGSGDEPLVTPDVSHGLRIYYGTHPEYREVGVGIRRVEGAGLIFPELRKALKQNSIYKTWQPQVHRIAIECLRASYGQEVRPASKRHESVRRTLWALVGGDRRPAVTELSNVSRSLVDDLTWLDARFKLMDPERLAKVTVEATHGLGQPETTSPEPGEYVNRFPMLDVPRLGETFEWGYRRLIEYVKGEPFQDGRVTITGNVRGFAVGLAVTFECDPPPVIWKVDRHLLRFMGPPHDGDIVRPDANGTVRFPETSDTVPEHAYGLAWCWP